MIRIACDCTEGLFIDSIMVEMDIPWDEFTAQRGREQQNLHM
jgi:hypothetical protein